MQVLSPGPHFLLAMKLAAGREVDFDDAVRLVREIGYEDVDQVLDLVDEAWGHTNVSMSVEYFTRAVCEEAADGRNIRSPRRRAPRRGGTPDQGGPVRRSFVKRRVRVVVFGFVRRATFVG